MEKFISKAFGGNIGFLFVSVVIGGSLGLIVRGLAFLQKDATGMHIGPADRALAYIALGIFFILLLLIRAFWVFRRHQFVRT